MISHIVNLIEIQDRHKESYLHVAQPVTLASMLNAKKHAAGTVDVGLYCVKHRDEDIESPRGFIQTEDLSRYAHDCLDAIPKTRNYPLIGDIISKLYEASTSEYFIYSNIDIGLFPNFYTRVKELIDSGHDALCINRRDMPKKLWRRAIDETNYHKLFAKDGKKHPGTDCFVFARSCVPRMNLGKVFIGAPPVGKVLRAQISDQASNFIHIKEEALTFHLGRDWAWNYPDNPFREENNRQAQAVGLVI